MRKTIEICMLIFALFSCSREKDTIDDEVLDILTIDVDSRSYINDDGKPFYDNSLTSMNDKHVYKLEMTKNVLYRISATQPETTVNQINLTLVNIDNDTMAISWNEYLTRTLLIISPPLTGYYYLIVDLIKWPNPKYGYRLNFEEIFNHPISFSGHQWLYDGTWSVNEANEAVCTNYYSNIYRHLKLASTVTTNPDVSFVIKSNSTIKPNFGIQIGGSDGLIQFGEFAYELESVGYAVLTENCTRSFKFIRLNYSGMSIDTEFLPNILDFSSGIKVELKYSSTEKSYRMYINNDFTCFFPGPIPLKNFYIFVQDCGEGATIIRDLVIN